jgi:hypothetical protein
MDLYAMGLRGLAKPGWECGEARSARSVTLGLECYGWAGNAASLAQTVLSKEVGSMEGDARYIVIEVSPGEETEEAVARFVGHLPGDLPVERVTIVREPATIKEVDVVGYFSNLAADAAER